MHITKSMLYMTVTALRFIKPITYILHSSLYNIKSLSPLLFSKNDMDQTVFFIVDGAYHWASKPNQNHILVLAICIERDFWEY